MYRDLLKCLNFRSKARQAGAGRARPTFWLLLGRIPVLIRYTDAGVYTF